MQPFRKSFILIFFFINGCFISNTLAQSGDGLIADEMFAGRNYIQALDEYLKLDKKVANDPELKHRIGICYLNIHDNKAKAIPYLEACYKSGVYKKELLLELGMAYQYDYKFTEALSYYNKYREKGSSKTNALTDHYIETCETAKELIKKPVNVTFENLGKEINTKFADYYPFVEANQGALYFTSRRDENTGKVRGYNGYYTADVYYSVVKNGQWTKAKKMIPAINTSEDEQCVGISQDGKGLIIYRETIDNPGDLIHSELSKTKVFTKPIPFNDPVNTEQSEFEGSYGTTSDILYFTSNRKGGIGESDIYIVRRLPNGEWALPKNLGANINTPYNESFPVISSDGETLYFSSQGHTNMGGYDIFKSKWNAGLKEWDKPVNIGYPINTTDDDMMYSLAGNGRDGYISAVKKDGFGDLDIYKIIFNDAEKPLTALHGKVQSSDSSAKGDMQAYIKITDLKSNNELDGKDVNKHTGKYIFIVEPGTYLINIEAKGFAAYKEEITVYDKSDFVTQLTKNFTLQPLPDVKAPEKQTPVEPKKK